ncbi:MAG: hypothetical protein MZU84_07940 [Sphingobacterium sp.]|nr:hypothetical protein [Sphingobacterium sp.]
MTAATEISITVNEKIQPGLKIKNLGKPINTIYWESHGFITPDGKTLYLSSNRQGGSGDLDIWKSEKKADGTWDNPVNCGEIINTPFNEDTPFFDQGSNALLFSSSGHISLGGYDVFRSIFRNVRLDIPCWNAICFQHYRNRIHSSFLIIMLPVL